MHIYLHIYVCIYLHLYMDMCFSYRSLWSSTMNNIHFRTCKYTYVNVHMVYITYAQININAYLKMNMHIHAYTKRAWTYLLNPSLPPSTPVDPRRPLLLRALRPNRRRLMPPNAPQTLRQLNKGSSKRSNLNISIYINPYIFMYMYTYKYLFIYIHLHMYIYVYISINMYLCIYKYINIYIYI
jgi:hypothetical protein